MTTETKAQRHERNTYRALARMSETNLPATVAMLDKRKKKARWSSNYQWLLYALKLDAHLGGRPFIQATPAELEDYLNAMRDGGASKGSVRLASIHTLAIMTGAFGLREAKDLPYEYRDALFAERPGIGDVHGAIMPETAFLAALEAVPRLHYQLNHAHELVRALLWLLWDSGMRIGELLSLCVSDVTFDNARGTAKLQLRAERQVSHGLKTDARFVIIRDAVPALKAWLGVHPGADPEAPLVTGLAYCRHPRPLNEDSANRVIKEVFGLVGAKPVGQREHFSAHDFRHSAATRDANNGDREQALRQKYGWGPKSPMPSYYVHMSEADAQARVLAKPPTGSTPAPAPTAPTDAMGLVAMLTAQVTNLTAQVTALLQAQAARVPPTSTPTTLTEMGVPAAA